jgi:hypothetical protein
MLKPKVKKGLFPCNYYTQIVDRYRNLVGKKLLFDKSVRTSENGESVRSGKLASINRVNRNRIRYGVGGIIKE